MKTLLAVVVTLSLVTFSLAMSALADATPLPPTHADVAYGPYKRNVLDFWQTEGAGPRPLLVFIHGGGWVGGDKKQDPEMIRLVVGQGHLVRRHQLSPDGDRSPSRARLRCGPGDSVPAVEGREWGIDKKRIAFIGGSAGPARRCGSCSTTTWPTRNRPIPSCGIDAGNRRGRHVGPDVDRPESHPEWVGPNVLKHRMIWKAVGETTMADALKPITKNTGPLRRVLAL